MKKLIQAAIMSTFLLVSLIPISAQAAKQPVEASAQKTTFIQTEINSDQLNKDQEQAKPEDKQKKDKTATSTKSQNTGGGVYISLGGLLIILIVLIILF